MTRPRTVRSARAAILLVATLTLVALALTTGCSGGSGTSDTVRTDVSAGSVALAGGQVLRIDFGAYNASIGDSWHLVSTPDPSVLLERGQDVDYDDDCAEGAVGCGGNLSWDFTAAGEGTTALVFRYCYRSRPDACDPGPDRGPAEPVTLTVTVR